MSINKSKESASFTNQRLPRTKRRINKLKHAHEIHAKQQASKNQNQLSDKQNNQLSFPK